MAESALSVAEIQALGQFGYDKRVRVERIGKHFEKTGTFGLWWDATISEEDRQTWLYFYLCLFKMSDKKAVLNEIQRYISFYKYLENLSNLSSEEFDDLDYEVKHFLSASKSRMRTTRSKTIYDVCKELVSSSIGRKIEKVRNAIGSHEYRKLKSNFEEVLKKESEEWEKKMKLELDTLTECSRVKAEENMKISENMAQEIADIDNRMTVVHNALVGIVQRLREERQVHINDIAVNEHY